MKCICPSCKNIIDIRTKSDKYYILVDQKERCIICDADIFITPTGIYTLEQYLNGE